MAIHKDVTLNDWNAVTRALVVELNADFPDFTYGTYGGHHPHKTRAVDAFVPAYRTAKGKARGWELARWIWANRVRLGVWYVIFDGKIISRTDGEDARWETYRPPAAAIKRSVDIAYHRDHVHTSTYLTAPAKATYTVKAGDNLTRVAAELGTTVPAIVALNPGLNPDAIRVGQVLTVPDAEKPTTKDYTVKAGDTLIKIAERFGIDNWRDLAALNPGINPDAINVGQVLKVPASAVEVQPKPEVPVAIIRVTSTNMRDDTLASSKAYPWSGRKAGYIDAVKSTDPDVVLIQEATKTQVADLCAGLGSTWTWWRAEDNSRDDGPLAIAWNTAVLERTGDGTEVELPSNRRGLRVPLKHEASGKAFDAVVSHLDNGAGVAKTRDAQAKVLAEWLPGDVKTSETSPMVFGADLNDKRTGSTGPRALLRAAGVKFIRDLVKVTNAEYESHHGGGTLSKGGGWIDDLGVRGMKVRKAGMVRTDRNAPVKAHRNASDHNILWAEVEL